MRLRYSRRHCALVRQSCSPMWTSIITAPNRSLKGCQFWRAAWRRPVNASHWNTVFAIFGKPASPTERHLRRNVEKYVAIKIGITITSKISRYRQLAAPMSTIQCSFDVRGDRRKSHQTLVKIDVGQLLMLSLVKPSLLRSSARYSKRSAPSF